MTGLANIWVRLTVRVEATMDALSSGGLSSFMVLSGGGTPLAYGRVSYLRGTTPLGGNATESFTASDKQIVDSDASTTMAIIYEGIAQVPSTGNLTVSMQASQQATDATYPATVTTTGTFVTAEILD
jgi:hypothetical protein